MPRNQQVVVHPGNNGWSMQQLANRAAAVYVANPQGWTNLYNTAIRNGVNYISGRSDYYQAQRDERDYSTSRRKISNRSPQSEVRSVIASAGYPGHRGYRNALKKLNGRSSYQKKRWVPKKTPIWRRRR
jgi:hypothetical protein